MSLLKDVALYANQVEADIDKSLLESYGIVATVGLPDRGSVTYRLQVGDSQYESAVRILREVRPELFGSNAKGLSATRDVKRQFLQLILACVVCTCLFCVFLDRDGSIFSRIWWSVMPGSLAGCLIVAVGRTFKK